VALRSFPFARLQKFEAFADRVLVKIIDYMLTTLSMRHHLQHPLGKWWQTIQNPSFSSRQQTSWAYAESKPNTIEGPSNHGTPLHQEAVKLLRKDLFHTLTVQGKNSPKISKVLFKASISPSSSSMLLLNSTRSAQSLSSLS